MKLSWIVTKIGTRICLYTPCKCTKFQPDQNARLQVQLTLIKTHGSVLCGPRSPGRAQTRVSIFTGTTKQQFLYIHRSVIFYLKITKFAVEVPACKGRLHTKIEVNHSGHFRDTSEQSFRVYFFSFSSLSFYTNHKIGSTMKMSSSYKHDYYS